MVDTEDNFNEFLKQKVEESHFEYNEAYWLKAEKLIENAEPKRKPFWFGFAWGALSLALVGGIAAIVLNLNQPKNKLAQTTQKSNVGLITNASAQETNTQKTQAVIAASQLNSKANHVQSKKITGAKVAVQNKTYANALASNNNKSGIKNSIVHSNVNEKSKQSNANITASVNNRFEGSFSQVKSLSLPKLPKSTVIENEDDDVAEDHKVITIAEPVIIRAKAPSVKDIDVNIVAACENKNKHEWMFNILAGVSDSRGFEGNTATTSRIGFGYFGGFRLGYKIDKNWFVGVQPLIYTRGAINTSIQTQKTAYDFGANADEFIVKNKALLFAEMPVSVGYRIQRHQISVGAGFEYLVNVKSDVKDFGTAAYTPNQWGYTNGFNRFGTIAIFNYAFNVYNQLWLTMMVQKGFTDLTKADYFTTNSKDKNLNLRIGVQYQFNNQKKKGK